MIAKQYKLPIQNFLRKSGKSSKSRFFLLKTFKTDNDFSRFGAIISNKVAKKATERNKLRRQTFNFFRIAGNRLPIADYLIIFFPNAAKVGEEQLQSELFSLINQPTK